MYQRFHVFKDNKFFFEGNVDFDDTIGEMLIMVKNLRKGKPGAGAWQWGEGMVATGRRCGGNGEKVWWQRGEGVGHGTSLPGIA